MAGFNLRMISGRFIFMSVLFTVVTTSLTILVIMQNQKSQLALHGIRDVRVPLRLITGNIIGSLDRVMSQQRAYMLSGDPAFKLERQKVYDEDIYPSIASLLLIKEKLNTDQGKAIGEIQNKVKEFEAVQGGILTYFEVNMLPLMQQVSKVGEEELINLNESLVAKLKAEKELGEKVKSADNIRASLLQLVTGIRNSQEKLLTTEIEGVTKGISASRFILITVSITIFIFLVIYTLTNIRSLKESINKPVSLINTLSLGALPEKIEASNDELNEILEAGQKLTKNIQAASQFALAIGEGRLEENYKEASDNDVLGKSLLHMRDRLQAISIEEQKRNWATAGIAELGNILRSNTNTEELYLNVLSYLIKYVKANQGALYLVEEKNGEPHLKLVSCYAYNKRKYINNEISPGEGLIGQAYLEKGLIFLREVPKEYIRITSGLGDAPPRSVLICPLLLNDEVFGIIEMASFSVFEKHEQDFVKLAANQVASVIASVRINERTAILLKEAQQQAEELRAQEEEMRQNMEELSATQEEMARKEKEYMSRIKNLEESINQTEAGRLLVSW